MTDHFEQEELLFFPIGCPPMTFLLPSWANLTTSAWNLVRQWGSTGLAFKWTDLVVLECDISVVLHLFLLNFCFVNIYLHVYLLLNYLGKMPSFSLCSSIAEIIRILKTKTFPPLKKKKKRKKHIMTASGLDNLTYMRNFCMDACGDYKC